MLVRQHSLRTVNTNTEIDQKTDNSCNTENLKSKRLICLKSSGVDAAVSFDFKDDSAELIGTYSQRLAEVAAHSSLEAISNNEGTSFNNAI